MKHSRQISGELVWRSGGQKGFEATLTCPPPAPLRSLHAPPGSPGDCTSRSSELQHTKSESACPEEENHMQRCVIVSLWHASTFKDTFLMSLLPATHLCRTASKGFSQSLHWSSHSKHLLNVLYAKNTSHYNLVLPNSVAKPKICDSSIHFCFPRGCNKQSYMELHASHLVWLLEPNITS